MILYLAWFFLAVAVCFYTLKSDKKTQMTAMTVYMLALGVFVGLGDMLGGYDRYIYGELFDRMADWKNMGGNPWLSFSFSFYGSEFGYGTFCALLTYVTSNRYIFIFIATMVIYVLLIHSLRRYVDNAPFAVVMFLGLWFFFTFTYLRQVIGATIVWLSVEYIIKRDLKRFLLVLFIAFSFHNSAIVFLPLYFMPFRKFTPKQVIVLMAIALVIGLSPIPQALFAAYGDVDADRMTANYEADAGFRWAYLMEAGFFLFVILANYSKISEEDDRELMMLNIALIFCAILLVFVRSENGGRLSWFFMIGVFCTMSNICVNQNRVLSYGTLLVIVSFFLFLRILDAWGNQLTPYKSFLTDGVRTPDYIHDKYEYDNNYDADKFYRPAFGN